MKRFFASLGHGLLWLALTYVIWGLIVRHRYTDAWKATTVGDSVPTVINRFGVPEYYSRFGFHVDPNLVLPDVPPEYFQAISLDSSRPRGNVSYHNAFNARG
jgi:hypothetical protein